MIMDKVHSMKKDVRIQLKINRAGTQLVWDKIRKVKYLWVYCTQIRIPSDITWVLIITHLNNTNGQLWSSKIMKKEQI